MNVECGFSDCTASKRSYLRVKVEKLNGFYFDMNFKSLIVMENIALDNGSWVKEKVGNMARAVRTVRYTNGALG